MPDAERKHVFAHFIGAVLCAAGSVWLFLSVQQVERLRAEGVRTTAQITGTQVRHTSDGKEVTQTYRYSVPGRSETYTGSFTPG